MRTIAYSLMVLGVIAGLAAHSWGWWASLTLAGLALHPVLRLAAILAALYSPR